MQRATHSTAAPSLHMELPPGLGDLLPEAAARLFALRERLLGVLGRWGYRPVLPPLLEYAEVFGRALPDPGGEVALHKLLDRTTGHVLALRPDFTPQIARAAATRFAGASLPLRLCYEGPVVRHVPAQRGRARQLHQVGAELLGALDAEADAEVLALVIEGLREAGLREFKVDVGQVEFFKGILRDIALSADDVARVQNCVARKDVSELGHLVEGLELTDAKRHLLAALPLLAGGVEVLDRAAALVESDHSRRALENLAQVVGFVERMGLAEFLTVDLGELRGVDYHTGVIFEAFVHQLGSPLCKGGRYDGLMANFGADQPATGFSLDLVAVMEALRFEEEHGLPQAAGALVVGAASLQSRAPELAVELREAGIRAARELTERPLAASVAHAREHGFRWVVAVKEQDALLVDAGSGAEQRLPLAEIARRLTEEE